MLTDLINYADLASTQEQTKGGRDNKYRKLRGTGMYARAIDNQRVQQPLGILTTTGKVKAGATPSEKDRSAYSCYRYQFFLKAPFEIGQGCCNVMKKAPAKKYTRETGRKPMLAQMASESKLRTQNWLHYGCNAFDAKKPASNPMSFWTDQDVLLYLYERKIPIASVYGEIVKDTEIDGQLDLEDLGVFDLGRPTLRTTGARRTGCMFCGFGCHLEKSPTRFELMKKTHPKQYEYIMKPWEEGGLGYKEIIDWINENGDLHIKY